LSSGAYRRFSGTLREGGLPSLAGSLFQQGGLFTGILLGHALERWTGLRPAQPGATTLLDSLALLIQFNVAGRVTRQAFGERFNAWERNLDQQAELMTQANLRARRPAVAAALAMPNGEQQVLPNVLWMSSNEGDPPIPGVAGGVRVREQGGATQAPHPLENFLRIRIPRTRRTTALSEADRWKYETRIGRPRALSASRRRARHRSTRRRRDSASFTRGRVEPTSE
jgi:hypothetical protein